jgi:hypothetical protein
MLSAGNCHEGIVCVTSTHGYDERDDRHAFLAFL